MFVKLHNSEYRGGGQYLPEPLCPTLVPLGQKIVNFGEIFWNLWPKNAPPLLVFEKLANFNPYVRMLVSDRVLPRLNILLFP